MAETTEVCARGKGHLIGANPIPLILNDKFDFKNPYYPYHPPVEGTIAIVAASPYLGHNVPSENELQLIKECGFNTINIFPHYSKISEALSVINKVGLKALLFHSHLFNSDDTITDKEAFDRCRNTVADFKSHPGLGGWTLPDQPSYDQLAAIYESSDSETETHPRCLLKFYDIIKKEDPAHLIHINLVGSPVSKFMDGHNYHQYMNVYQRNFRPGLWSYDLYPISEKNGKIEVERNRFYLDFELYALRSRLFHRPFWAYCQSQGFITEAVSRPNPKEEYLRYEAFSALGYGAQGIVYWTYHQREDTLEESFLSAPVDLNGNTTPIWDAVKHVNEEIDLFNDIFFGCQLIDCKHTVKKYDGTCILPENTTFGPFTKVLTDEGLGIQISHLNTKGQDYIVIVNHDVEKEQTIKLTRPSLQNVIKYDLHRSESEVKREEVEIGDYSEHSLTPGGYIIFKWNQL